MSDTIIRAILGGPVVAFHARLVPILGSIPATLMLQQLVYASERGVDGQGYFERTQDWFTETTGLTWRQQQRARVHLIDLGVLSETRRGNPARLAYRLDFRCLEALLDAAVSDLPKRESSFAESASLDSRKARVSSLEENVREEVPTEPLALIPPDRESVNGLPSWVPILREIPTYKVTERQERQTHSRMLEAGFSEDEMVTAAMAMVGSKRRSTYARHDSALYNWIAGGRKRQGSERSQANQRRPALRVAKAGSVTGFENIYPWQEGHAKHGEWVREHPSHPDSPEPHRDV